MRTSTAPSPLITESIARGSPRRTERRGGRAQAGLDLGMHSAKLVVRHWRAGAWRITGAGCLRLSPASFSSAAELSSALLPWLREHEALGRSELVCNLPSALTDYEAVEREPGGNGDEADAAREALAQLLGEDFSQAAYDYWRITVPGGEERPQPLQLAWTGGEFAAQIAHRLAAVSGSVRAIDVPAAVLARISPPDAPGNQPHLVADISQGEVSLVWVCGGGPGYVRNRIQFAALSAAAELARGLGVREASAETLLAAWGLDAPAAEAGGPISSQLERELGDWLKKLLFEISRTIQYVRHRHGGSAVSQLVLTGGGACLRGLAPWLADRLQLPVRPSTLPAGWIWEAAEPFSPLYSQAVALTRYGDLP